MPRSAHIGRRTRPHFTSMTPALNSQFGRRPHCPIPVIPNEKVWAHLLVYHRLLAVVLLLLLLLSVLHLHLLADAASGHFLQDTRNRGTETCGRPPARPICPSPGERKRYLAVRVDQAGDDVTSGPPGRLAFPQEICGRTVGHAGVCRPHLHKHARVRLSHSQKPQIFTTEYTVGAVQELTADYDITNDLFGLPQPL